MDEQALRDQIAKEISSELKYSLENCAALSRDAYGQYIDNLHISILNKITQTK
jgi:hypothetical protein